MNTIHLEKYKNTSQKKICPNCGKKTFVQYVDDRENYIHPTVGRCDRTDKCGYHYSPKEYFAEHTNGNTDKQQFYKPKKKTEPKKIGYIPMQYITELSNKSHSYFIFFLLNFFDTDTLQKAIDQYKLGCYDNYTVVFPQIDDTGKCRTAKIQLYNPKTGKREKNKPYSINWLHSVLKKKKLLPEDFQQEMCLFGLHLIQDSRNYQKPVCIVESEKTAVIASCCFPEYVWLASGALDWLNINKLKPLKGRKIILHPDTSETGTAFQKWTKIADNAKLIGYDISVSAFLEDACTPEEKQQGYDLADFLIDRLKEKQQ